jgi:hypothetical protein
VENPPQKPTSLFGWRELVLGKWEFERCGTKNPLIGLLEWELRREGDRELRGSTPLIYSLGGGR